MNATLVIILLVLVLALALLLRQRRARRGGDDDEPTFSELPHPEPTLCGLPREVRAKIVKKLSPTDRGNLEGVCRELNISAKDAGIMPSKPDLIKYIDLAISKHNGDMLKKIVKIYGEMDVETQQTVPPNKSTVQKYLMAIMNSIIKGYEDLDIMKFLLENGAEVNFNDENAPLINAVSYIREDAVSLLVQHGADLNYKINDRYGGVTTPFMLNAYDVSSNNPDLIRRLLELGANINDTDAFGDTLLCLLAYEPESNLQLIRDVVIRHNPDVSIKCHYGTTAYDMLTTFTSEDDMQSLGKLEMYNEVLEALNPNKSAG